MKTSRYGLLYETNTERYFAITSELEEATKKISPLNLSGIYIFENTNRHARRMIWMCLKLTIKTPERVD